MSNYASIDPITGLQDDQAVLPESFGDLRSQPGAASAGPAPGANAATGLGQGTGIASLGLAVEPLSLGVASGTSETDLAMAAVKIEGQTVPIDPSSNPLLMGWPPPPPGGGGWW